MFIRLLLALFALMGLMWFMSWYAKADPVQRNKALKTGLMYFIAIALLLLVVTGRIPWLFAGVSAAIPFIMRLARYRSLFKLFAGFAGKTFGATKLTTQWLVIEYDLANHSLDALISKGQFTDQRLTQLNSDELNSLLAEVKDDFQSRAAVHAFILAKNGQSNHAGNSRNKPPPNSQISTSQAYEILGLDKNANERDIKIAHKRLMQKLHPDKGGSSYLAAQINAAKDTLLNKQA